MHVDNGINALLCLWKYLSMFFPVVFNSFGISSILDGREWYAIKRETDQVWNNAIHNIQPRKLNWCVEE